MKGNIEWRIELLGEDLQSDVAYLEGVTDPEERQKYEEEITNKTMLREVYQELLQNGGTEEAIRAKLTAVEGDIDEVMKQDRSLEEFKKRLNYLRMVEDSLWNLLELYED